MTAEAWFWQLTALFTKKVPSNLRGRQNIHIQSDSQWDDEEMNLKISEPWIIFNLFVDCDLS